MAMGNLNKFKKSLDGIAAIEFAILLPFLLVVFFGVYEMTTYITTVRKIDNITNDINYIISREGQIATTNPDGTFTGGQADLLGIINGVTPFLIYPYKYDPANSVVRISYVGLPIFSACSNDSIDRQHVRVMWMEQYGNVNNTKISPIAFGADQCGTDADHTGGANCPFVCNDSNQGTYYSLFKNLNVTRANIIYPGQSFILVNFAFNFKALFTSKFVGIGLPATIEKQSSYAARSRLLDLNKDGRIEPNEVVNNMQYCTDCDTYTSTYGFSGGALPMATDNSIPYRQICDPSLLNDGAAPSASGGCNFY